MKSVLSLLPYVALASCLVIPEGVSHCAAKCLEPSIRTMTTCGLTDWKCICANYNLLYADAAACIVAKCDREHALTVVRPTVEMFCRRDVDRLTRNNPVEPDSIEDDPESPLDDGEEE